MPDFVSKLLENNRNWVKNKLQTDADFFNNLSSRHEPQLLWIGCSDARVPANQITGTVDTNGGVRSTGDFNRQMSDTSAVRVAMMGQKAQTTRDVITNKDFGIAPSLRLGIGLIDNWLRHVKDVYRLHLSELEAIKDENVRYNRLAELNVMQQVYNLCKTSIVQSAWQKGEFPYIHGWVYDVHDGILKDLEVTFNSHHPLPDLYKFDGI